MRRAVVTGAEGFLGRHLVRELRRLGVGVTTLGRLPNGDAFYTAMGDAPWPSDRLAGIIRSAEPDAIFHLVGGAVGSEAELQLLNTGVALSVMEAVIEARVQPLLVFCGSAAEYGLAVVDGVPICETVHCEPVSGYGTAKLAQTRAALAFTENTGIPVLVARIFNPIGPGLPTYLALGDFARQIALMPSEQGRLQTGNIDIFRDFVDVNHVASALHILACNPDARGVINVCSGHPTGLRTLVDMLIAASGKTITLETDPARLRPGELRTVLGDTSRLDRFGAKPPPIDCADVIARIWQDAKMRWAGT